MYRIVRNIVFIMLLVPGLSYGQDKEWTFGPFERPEGVTPVITPNPETVFYCPMRGQAVRWEAMATFNPAAVVKDNKIYVLYRAEDKLGEMKIGGHTSRIGMAMSEDGLTFTRNIEPVMYPKPDEQKKYEWPGGVEDPRIVETEEGMYVLTYTQWNRNIPRLAVATSEDLINWEKHGPVFKEAYNGKYHNIESKSGAILSRREGNRLVATKINSKYWMYWGVPEIYLATSEDLINWTPVENDKGELKAVLSTREGHFDSWLVEAGPPALITDKGILVMYNAGNSGQNGDPDLPDRVYSGGQALFDLNDPMKLKDRIDEPFIKPEMPFERTGQYESGTTFLEGLVFLKGRWFIYYGTADSRVGVVTWHPSER